MLAIKAVTLSTATSVVGSPLHSPVIVVIIIIIIVVVVVVVVIIIATASDSADSVITVGICSPSTTRAIGGTFGGGIFT